MTSSDPTHECPGGCGRPVPGHLLSCKTCWYRLPLDLRNEINAAYRRRGRAGHAQAVAAAVEWYVENPRKATG